MSAANKQSYAMGGAVVFQAHRSLASFVAPVSPTAHSAHCYSLLKLL